MRLVVKKWGNGLAVRLPRNNPTIGRLEEGMEVEVEVRPRHRTSNTWRPYTVDLGITDASENHDAYIHGYLDDRHASPPTRRKRR